jgi:hypothetical protein
MTTKRELTALLDARPEVTGEGPFLLVTLSLYEGLLLTRFKTHQDASTQAMNYMGPAHWIFEVGEQLSLYADFPMVDE